MMQRYKLYVNMLNKETVAVLCWNIWEIDASFYIVFENQTDQICVIWWPWNFFPPSFFLE